MLGIGPFGQPKLAQDDGPLCEEPVHHRGIAPRRGGAVNNAPGARDFPCLIDQILQRQGNAVKTTERLTPGALRIEGGGAGEAAGLGGGEGVKEQRSFSPLLLHLSLALFQTHRLA